VEASTGPGAVIRDYYVSVALARAILEACPELEPSVHRFLEGHVSIDDDLRPLLREAVAAGKRIALVRRVLEPVPRESLPEEPLGPPLGDVDAEDRLVQMSQKRDPRLLQLSDEGLRRVMHRSYGVLTGVHVSVRDEIRKLPPPTLEWHIGMLRLMNRMVRLQRLEIGDAVARRPSLSQSLASTAAEKLRTDIPPDQAHDPALMDELARIFYYSRTNTAWIWALGRIEDFRPYLEARARLERRILGAAAAVERRSEPLGGRGPLGHETAFPASRDETTELDVADSVVRSLLGRNDFRVEEWLETCATAQPFRLAARLFEIAHEDAFDEIRRDFLSYIQRPIPAELVGERSIPWILRMLKAFGDKDGRPIEPSSVRIRLRPGVAPIPLTEHPDFANAQIPSRKAVRAVVDAAWRILDTRLEATADVLEERAEALERLLAGSEPAVDFPQIIPGLVERLRSGRLARLEDGDAARKALAEWNHVGVVSLFAGLLTELDREEIQSLLEAKGHADALAASFADAAVRLRELRPKQAAYAIEDLARHGDAPDFSTLMTRLALIDRLDIATIRGIVKDAPDRAAGCARALLELALEEDGGSAARKTVLDLLEGSIAKGCLDAADLRGAVCAVCPLQGERTLEWPLAPDIVQPLIDAIDDSASLGTEQGLSQAADKMKRLSWFLDPNQVAGIVLERAYAHDVAKVLPLKDAPLDNDHHITSMALHFLEELGCAPEEASARIDQTPKWMALAIEHAVSERISEDALVGLASLYASHFIPATLLARARDMLPRSVVKSAWARVRSASARAVLKNRPAPAQPMSRVRMSNAPQRS
jgi:hypothetical protein